MVEYTMMKQKRNCLEGLGVGAVGAARMADAKSGGWRDVDSVCLGIARPIRHGLQLVSYVPCVMAGSRSSIGTMMWDRA